MRYFSLISFLLLPVLSGQEITSPLANKWRDAGKTFTWKSTFAENSGRNPEIFYACMGDEAKPAILMIHGWPTSSFDFHPLIAELQADYRICTLDFPGYGLSAKPANGYRYGLRDDAVLAWYFVTEIVKLKEFALLSHDRGDSVALAFLELYQAAANPPFRITHQFLSNGNMYLPLANLSAFQQQVLAQGANSPLFKSMNAKALATGMGLTTYTPPLGAADPEVAALADMFAHDSGVEILPATIQYLNERKAWEEEFLQALAKSAVPATLIWGIHDLVSPVRVADHVWDVSLKSRKAAATYWLIPCGSHYLQHDQPGEIAKIVKLSLGKGAPAAPFNLSPTACGAVLNAKQP